MNKYLKLLPIVFLALFLVACAPEPEVDSPLPDTSDEDGSVEDVDAEDDGLNAEFVNEDEDIDLGEPI